MDKEKKYDCSKCLNRCTPICEQCNYIETPSGGMSEPTRFIEDIGENKTAERAVVLTSLIGYRLKIGKPIPLSWIIEYNSLTMSGNK